MSISIVDTLKAFTTSKYDKTNIFYFILIMLVFSISCFFVDFENTTGTLILGLLLLIVSVIQVGYYVLTSHNEIHQKESIFPSLSEISSIIFAGAKYTFGMTIVMLISYILPVAVLCGIGFGFFFYYLNSKAYILSMAIIVITAIVTIIIAFLILYFVVFPLMLMFMQSLHFSDLFAFDKIKLFRLQKGNQLVVYFLFVLLISIIINFVAVFVTFGVSVAGVIASVKSLDVYTNIITFLVVAVGQTLLLPNLNGQIVRYDVSLEEKFDDYEECEYYDEPENGI